MLMASQIIAYSFKANIDELSVVRTDWTASYADDLVTRVDTTLQKYLGIDAKQELRSATVALTAVQGSAQKDLSFLKAQLDDDFKKDPARRDEILKVLGFAKHLRDVQKNNQEALTQLLFTFKTNVTEQLTQEIVAKGTNPALLERIAGYADTFKQANLSQETNKSASKEVTREAADALVSGGLLAMEVDARRASLVAELVAGDRRYRDVGVHLDLTGRERFVLAQRR